MLALIYFVEIIIFIIVILNVRRLFKFLDRETYQKLKLPIGVFILFTIGFLIFRISFFIVLQFQLMGESIETKEVLKFLYYMSVILLISLLSFVGHKSIKENDGTEPLLSQPQYLTQDVYVGGNSMDQSH